MVSAFLHFVSPLVSAFLHFVSPFLIIGVLHLLIGLLSQFDQSGRGHLMSITTSYDMFPIQKAVNLSWGANFCFFINFEFCTNHYQVTNLQSYWDAASQYEEVPSSRFRFRTPLDTSIGLAFLAHRQIDQLWWLEFDQDSVSL